MQAILGVTVQSYSPVRPSAWGSCRPGTLYNDASSNSRSCCFSQGVGAVGGYKAGCVSEVIWTTPGIESRSCELVLVDRSDRGHD
jgi:hypothetical protein